MKRAFIGSVSMVLAILASGCHDWPAAPPPVPPPELPYVTLTIDHLLYGADVIPAWGTPILMLEPDQSTHVVSMDYWDSQLRYAGCGNDCDDPAHWFTGTADTNSNGFFSTIGSVLTQTGFHVVYMTGGPVIKYAHCPGACQFSQHWQSSPLFRGSIGGNGPQTTALAADSSGVLHLFYVTLAGDWYAECGSACGDSVSWQATQLDSVPGFAYAMAVAPTGQVDLLSTVPGTGVRFATCVTACTTSTNWQSLLLDTVTANGATIAVGPDGRVHAAYLTGSAVHYATCASLCTSAGSWQTVALGVTSGSVSLAVDQTGRVSLATSADVLSVARCASGCLNPANWLGVVVDSANGGGYVSLALDSAGHARVASAVNRLQYTRLKQ